VSQNSRSVAHSNKYLFSARENQRLLLETSPRCGIPFRVSCGSSAAMLCPFCVARTRLLPSRKVILGSLCFVPLDLGDAACRFRLTFFSVRSQGDSEDHPCVNVSELSRDRDSDGYVYRDINVTEGHAKVSHVRSSLEDCDVMDCFAVFQVSMLLGGAKGGAGVVIRKDKNGTWGMPVGFGLVGGQVSGLQAFKCFLPSRKYTSTRAMQRPHLVKPCNLCHHAVRVPVRGCCD
jgi:hypothetical protein